MSSFPSRAKYYAFVVVFLIALDLFILYYLVPINPDLNLNLFSEIWGIIATVLLLMVVIEYREYKEWKTSEKQVNKRLGLQLYGIFDILARFVYPTPYELRPSKEEVTRILKELNTMKDPPLTKYVYQNFLPKPVDSASLFLLENLFEYKQNIVELEMKYSRFLQQDLMYSLMEIHDNLNSIKNYFNLLKTYPNDVQLPKVIEQAMPKPVFRIMKELYKIHKMGLEIRPKQSESTKEK